MLTDDERERFWSCIDKTSSCWLWTPVSNAFGYGVFRQRGGGAAYVHRIAYEELVGPIPPGWTIDHLCRVKRCVNPAHLEPCTRAENARRNRVQPTLF
jgi:hypothetical protein